MVESPLILSESAKKAKDAEFAKKKQEFDRKLVDLMLAEGLVVVPLIKYSSRGIFAVLDFEVLSEETRKMMEAQKQK